MFLSGLSSCNIQVQTAIINLEFYVNIRLIGSALEIIKAININEVLMHHSAIPERRLGFGPKCTYLCYLNFF